MKNKFKMLVVVASTLFSVQAFAASAAVKLHECPANLVTHCDGPTDADQCTSQYYEGQGKYAGTYWRCAYVKESNLCSKVSVSSVGGLHYNNQCKVVNAPTASTAAESRLAVG